MKAQPIFLIFAVLLTGCGVGRPSVLKASPSTYNVSAASAGAGLNAGADANYVCPASNNIAPDYDTNLNGTGFYQVCTNRDSKEKVAIHGRPTASATKLCVFPVEAVDENHIYWKPDLQTGGPWSRCYDITDTGVYAQFEGVSYNAVFIVDSLTANTQMQECLLTGYRYCPSYSFGKFR